MEFVIWNKTDVDKIDVVLSEKTIKVMIDDVETFSKLIKKPEDMKIYTDILDDVEKINETYISGDEINFQKLSQEFLEKLKML